MWNISCFKDVNDCHVFILTPFADLSLDQFVVTFLEKKSLFRLLCSQGGHQLASDVSRYNVGSGILIYFVG